MTDAGERSAKGGTEMTERKAKHDNDKESEKHESTLVKHLTSGES